MNLKIYTGEPTPADEQQADEPQDGPESLFLGQYIPLHYHYNMLQDEDRVGAFRRAIELCVKPGMRVLELGGGTGILSFLAARQGAQVTCVEKNPQLVLSARQFLEQNGVGDVVEVIAGDARRFIPQEPVDVVICEMLHVAMLREKQLQVIEAFKDHYQQAFSLSLPRFLPEATLLMVQPVEQSFDFADYWAPVPLFHAATKEQQRTAELGPFATYATIFYDEPFPLRFHWSGQLTVEQAGRLTALRFVTQNAIAIDEPGQCAINWPNQCLVIPVDEPIELNQGQSLQVEFEYTAGDSIEALSQSLRVCAPSPRQANTAPMQATGHNRSTRQQQGAASRPTAERRNAA